MITGEVESKVQAAEKIAVRAWQETFLYRVALCAVLEGKLTWHESGGFQAAAFYGLGKGVVILQCPAVSHGCGAVVRERGEAVKWLADCQAAKDRSSRHIGKVLAPALADLEALTAAAVAV